MYYKATMKDKNMNKKFEPIDKYISAYIIEELELLAEKEYRKEMTLKEYESEVLKIAGYDLQRLLLKQNRIAANVQITTEILEAGKSSNGSWNEKQIQALRSTMKKNKGWRKQLIGKIVSQYQVDRFLELKDAHIKSS